MKLRQILIRKDIRSIEQDLLTSRHTTEEATQLQQTTTNYNTEKKLDCILEQMKKMRKRMDGLERKFNEATKVSKETTSSDDSASSSSSVKRTPLEVGMVLITTSREEGAKEGGRGFYRRQEYQGQSKQQTDPKTDSNPSSNKEN